MFLTFKWRFYFLSRSLPTPTRSFQLIDVTCKFNLAPPLLLLPPLSWLVLQGLHFWCTISTQDPLLVTHSSRAALLVPHFYLGSTSGGPSFMGCTSGAPSLHEIHFWWLVLHGMHFWCPISTRDPLLVARSSWAALLVPISTRDPLLVARFSWAAPLVPISTRNPLLVACSSWAALLVPTGIPTREYLHSLTDLIFPCMSLDKHQFKSCSSRRSLIFIFHLFTVYLRLGYLSVCVTQGPDYQVLLLVASSYHLGFLG